MSCLCRKVLAALLLVVGMASVGAAQTAAGAKPFVSRDGHFHVQFPGEPQAGVKQATTSGGAQVDLHWAMLKQNDGRFTYAVMSHELPPTELKAQADRGKTDLDRVDDCAWEFVNGAVVDIDAERAIKLPGVVGKEFEFSRPEGMKCVFRVYVVGGRIYQLMVAWNGAAPTANEVTGFLDSFGVDN